MVIENPIGGAPKDPYEEYRRQKHGQEKENHPPKQALFTLAQVILWMRKILDSFIKAPAPKAIDTSQPLHLLKEAFERLKKEDASHEVIFSNTLSTCWNQTLILSRKINSKLLRAFIKEIQSYPKDQDHTLGYYLTEYAGQNWLPFPYIELLQKMHEEHIHKPLTSILTRWTRELEQLIATLAD